MQELNGFELAAKIQETAPDILIIFVSAYESYVYKSFEFRPFRFIAENQQGIEKIPFRKNCIYLERRQVFIY